MSRPLTPDERALLDGLLAHDFPGVEALRQQAPHATASPGCDCGCGTVDLDVPPSLPRSAAESPVPAEGSVVDASGEPVGGLLLFLDDGRLSSLEVHAYDDPLPLPRLERVRWELGPSEHSGEADIDALAGPAAPSTPDSCKAVGAPDATASPSTRPLPASRRLLRSVRDRA